MVYQAWSVVFGEQPSAAKWNILGSNDAEFNSMIVHTSGGLTTLNDIRVQNDNSDAIGNTTEDNVLIQTGWVQIDGDDSEDLSQAITFPTAFDTVLNLLVTFIGFRTASAAASITGFTGAPSANATATAWEDLTTTGFTLWMVRDGTNFTSGTRYGASWIAIGNKA